MISALMIWGLMTMMTTASILGLSPAGFHKIVYYAYGNPSGRLTVCVHGLTRNGRDFDRLAARLAESGRYVVCPDIVGRGQSDWLPRPELYGYPQYLADMAALLARLGDVEVDWVGTSMGGLIGMMLAAQPHTPIRRLVLNDIGPFVPASALDRLKTYVGKYPPFETLADAEKYLRVIHAPFGITSDADWQSLTATSVRQLPGGGYGLAYDPAIGAAFGNAPVPDVNLWPVWDMIRCPVMVLRGASSDLLLEETAAEMTRRGPKARLVEIAGAGHAPALLAPDQIEAVRSFLEA